MKTSYRKFPLGSEQLELLYWFENSESLEQLSRFLCKDPSVVSRRIKKLSEELPVMQKRSGRWHITPLGREINRLTESYLKSIERCVPKPELETLNDDFATGKAMLLVVNAQKAFEDPFWGPSSTPTARKNILSLLERWRSSNNPVVHVAHRSEDPTHPFFMDGEGAKIMEELSPVAGEKVIHKSSASAFTNTNLGLDLRRSGVTSVVIVGFTAAECIDATAKQGSDLGFKVFVPKDGAATFNISEESKFSEVEVHQFTMHRLSQGFAHITETSALLSALYSVAAKPRSPITLKTS